MDPLTRILIRLAQWHRNPPPRRTIVIILVVLGLALLLVAIERFVGWPDWATTDRAPIRRM
jgi:hypothetical protein